MADRARFKELVKQGDYYPGNISSATEDNLVILGADQAIVKFFGLLRQYGLGL